MKKILYSFLIILFCCSVALAQSSDNFKLSVKGSVLQGSVLFLAVSSDSLESITAEAEFRSKKATFFSCGDLLQTSVPVALDCPKGAYKLTVSIFKNGEKIKTLERVIKTEEHTYGRQQLWLSESQLATYDDPQADKDNDDILKALSFQTDGIKWENKFITPTAGRVSTLFGLKRFYNDDPEPEFHRGVDISAPSGQKIVATQNGIVRMAKRNLVLHGDTVVLDHGRGVGSIYIHMNSISVKEGDVVKQGQVIGTVGAKGVSTGPHLHWAVYSCAVPVDPKQLVNMPSDWIDK